MGFYKHDDFTDWEPGSFRRMWNNDKFVAARRIWAEPRSPLPEGHLCVAATKCGSIAGFRCIRKRSSVRMASRGKPPPAVRSDPD